MKTIDINKVNVILTMTKEHLIKHESYRFACELTESELTLIRGHFEIGAHDFDYSGTKLYELTKKQTNEEIL